MLNIKSFLSKLKKEYHMKMPISIIYISLILFMGCNKSDETPQPSQDLNFDFEDGVQGWTAGMSDFNVDWDPEKMEFAFAHTSLPAEVNANGNSLMISGRNLSDDLFLFIKKEITGLKANHTYSIDFVVEFASQYPEESVGIGGSPGSSVYLKAGGATTEPQVIEEEGMWQMNIDKGNQSQGGNNMKVIGTVGIPGEEFKYTLINRKNDNPIQVTTDANGTLWVIIGTDSGFESTTTIYYNTISIKLNE